MSAARGHSTNPIAVVDLGKTNTKIFVFSSHGDVIAQYRTEPRWVEIDAISVLDDAASEAWIQQKLADAVQVHNVDAVMFSGHGCTFALIRENALAFPILDYEQAPPDELTDQIAAQIPHFSETFSPPLPLGYNFSRHLLWMELRHPQRFADADTILTYPQFWAWRLSGNTCSEVSYLGCHSDLWAPLDDDYSSLVISREWRAKMPAMVRAGAVIGHHDVALPDGTTKPIAVHNGVHDSNAALYYYRSILGHDFTLISTGTWVVIFNPSCPPDALNMHRDMLANVTVDHDMVATIRFMGGREYEVIADGYRETVTPKILQTVVEKGIFALPSFAAGGPMQNLPGALSGPEPDRHERAGVAILYVALMCDLSLDLIQSHNPLVIDGGLTKSPVFAGLIGQLRTSQNVSTSPLSEGSAFGAAALAFEATGCEPFIDQTTLSTALEIRGLQQYRDHWRALIDLAWQTGAYPKASADMSKFAFL
ncbi:MAG: FGGY-family carbohydrate kinase [Halocynthiibacter sp.]